MKNIVNVVVTGGPCGGKTTALDELGKFFRSMGYVVFIVNETATELINDGIRPFGEQSLELLDFQRLILKAQLAKEEIRTLAAKNSKNDNVAIIYDRGILDNRAYLKEVEFQQILREEGIKEASILSRYDLVIHLVTAAVGKEQFYTTQNNSARTETIEQARESDKRTMSAWRNHPNQVIIPNDTLFDEKIQKVKNAIRMFLGEKEVISQKRYLILEDGFDFKKFQKYEPIKEVIQEFVSMYDDETDEMFSESTIDGSSFYTKTTNVFLPSGECVKRSRNISGEEYYESLRNAKSKPIKKTRCNLIYDGERYRVDFYSLLKKDLIILERDVVKSGDVKYPDFIKKAVNITENRNYSDDSICIDNYIDSLL